MRPKKKAASVFGLPHLSRADADEVNRLPGFVRNLQAPFLTGPELAIQVLEHSACVTCRLPPSRFVICQLLALVVGVRSNVVDVEEISRHSHECR